MAKGSIMLQLAVEQILSPAVSTAPEIWAVALDTLACLIAPLSPEQRP